MKLPTEQEIEGHAAATLRGGIEGTVASLAVGIPASYLLHRRWAYYRSLPLAIKALGVVLIVGPAFAIQAERRGVEYDRSTWSDVAKFELDREELREHQRWGSLSPLQKMGDWASRNQYTIIFGCWAASMAGSWLLLSRNKTETFSQRLVQARVYAQGITVATVLGAALLSQKKRAENLKQKGVDHSWRDFVEEPTLSEKVRNASHHL